MSRFFEPLLEHFADDFAVDLGTANTRIWRKGRGLVLSAPSLVALEGLEDGPARVVAVGAEAKALLGREPRQVRVTAPLRGGVVVDGDGAAAMLGAFFAGLPRPLPGLPRRAVLGVPAGATGEERCRAKEALLKAGMQQVYLIDEPLAVAIGAELPIDEATGWLVIDVGAGTTEIALIATGGIQQQRTLPLGGAALDQALVDHLQESRGLRIAAPTAEALKIALGGIGGAVGRGVLSIPVQRLAGGPASVEIDAAEVAAVLANVANDLLDAIVAAVGALPVAATVELLERGVLLAGGGALLPGFEDLLAERLHLPVRRVAKPCEIGVAGSARVLDYLGVLRRLEEVNG